MTRIERDMMYNEFKGYEGKYVVIRHNGKLGYAEFIDIRQSDYYIHLYINGRRLDSDMNNDMLDIGGNVGVHMSTLDVLYSCDTKEELKELFKKAKIEEIANKYNI